VVIEELGNETLKFRADVLVKLLLAVVHFGETLPVGVPLASVNKTIEHIVLLGSLFEWHNAGHECEQSHSQCKNVSSHASIRFPLVHFGSHVQFCPCIGVENPDHASFSECLGECEVAKFDLEVLVEQNVFQFEVSMYHLGLGMEVVHCVEYLFEKVTGQVFPHGTLDPKRVVKQIPVVSLLHENEVCDSVQIGVTRLIRGEIDCAGPVHWRSLGTLVRDHLDDVWMVKALMQLRLML